MELKFGVITGGGPNENMVNCDDAEAWFSDQSYARAEIV